MTFSFNELKTARDRGYSDDEIWNILSSEDKEIGLAKQRGYSLDEVASITSGQPIPQQQQVVEEVLEPSGVLRQAADIPIKFAQGVVGSVRSMTDLFGANNPVSKSLAGYEDYFDQLMSAESKQDAKEVSRLLKDAEDKGIYDKVIAGLNAFAKAPLEMTAQSAGYMVPQLAVGVLGKAAGLTKAGIVGAQAVMGFGQGVGTIKGDIYEAVKDELRDKGIPEDKIDKIATEAQAYNGKNLDQMLIGGGLLALDATNGAERALTRVLTKQGKEVSGEAIAKILKGVGISEKTAKSIAPVIEGVGKGIALEAPMEGTQEGQEQVASNLALQRLGYDVPTFKGVVSRATTGAAAGFAVGAAAGGIEAMSPEQKAEKEIDKDADKEARNLETPIDNPAATALSNEITNKQNAIDNLRSDLDALEPNDPNAQSIRLQVTELQKTLTNLQQQYQKITGIDQNISPASIAAARKMEIDSKIEQLTQEISSAEESMIGLEEGSIEKQAAQTELEKKKQELLTLTGPSTKVEKPLSETITPTNTKESIQTRIEELNKEFDALDEVDIKGQDRVNQAIFAEQNKLAELTAIEQGVEPQGTTPTRQAQPATKVVDRPVLQAFVKATDKVLGGIKATGKRAQKLKNAIRTGIANNAGFLAGTNTEVISSEEYGKLTRTKQVAADTGTYRATFFNGKKYLVVPDVNQLAGISIQGEQQVATRDAALDQEARAAVKKLEEEVIHLSMFQGIQDEYKSLKNPKLTEREYVVKRISDIAKEVKRTNPNALPGVSNAYLNDNSKLLDDMTFSQEFMRMVIQRVRTGQITEDLNAIRQAEQEAFSDKDKGAIISLKNSILNALQFVRNSIARYLGKGTSTKEVKRMEDAINNILDGYGIVKGEANYEFKDYSKAEPTVKESLPVQPPLPQRTISDAIKDKDTFVFEGMRGAISLEDGTVIFREFGTNNTYEVPVNPNQNISEISGIEWVRKGQTKKIAAEPTVTEVSAIIESDPQISEEEVNAEQNDFQVPQSLVEIEKSQVLNYIAEVLNTGESKIVKDGKRKQKVSQTPEFYSQITPRQIELANRQIDTALRIIDGLPISDDQKQSLAEPYLLIDQDITSYENNPEYKRIKDSKRREVFPTDQDVALTETGGQVEAGAVSETITPAIEARAASYVQDIEVFDRNGENKSEKQIVVTANSPNEAAQLVRNTQEYQNLSQKSKAKKLKFFTIGEPRLKRGAGEFGISARAGVSPKPSSKISKIEREVTQQVINDIESMINDLDIGKDTSGKAYESKTAQKGKKYAYSLVSPFSQAINLFTTTTHKESLNAFNKVLKGNPDASFFDITSNLTLRDVNGQMVVTYGLTPTELSNLIPLLRVVAPTYRQMIMDSDASFADRTRIALNMPAIEYGLSKATAVLMQTAGRVLNAAKQMRQFGGYGFAVANYKSKVVESIGGLWSKVGGDMADVAEAVRGDRRKAVDNVFNLSRMISKAVALQKMAVRNPEKARQSIRNAISRKQNRKTKEILLEFCANTFGEETEKYANMIIDQTAQAILAIGSGKKNISTDATYKKIYNAISSVAKQTAQEEQKKQEGNKKREVKPREGKFLQQVGMVIGNDKTYKQFIDELKKSIRREYQSDAAFNNDYKTLFDMLSTRQWSDNMRTQAIKDSADALNYKFADLFSYIGSKRTGAQADVKAHITSELKDTGASQEMIDKFISDVDSYLNDETMRVLEKKLGFQIDEKTKKIIGGQVIKENMRALATAEGQFKFAKTLKGLTRLAASDQRNFLDKLNELIITELGFDEATSNELSKYIDDEISKAIVQQQSDNLKQALDRATKTLENNNIKRVGTQRTLLKRLIEMANMGQLDDMKVYEAFRQTHNFSKGYLEYNPEFVQTLREWGDRISSLPEGVLRGIEEQKLGRYMLEKGVFTTTDYLSSYWYFSLLSQTGTQAMNVLGSTFNLLGNMAVWATYTKGKSVFPMMKALSRAITGKQSPASNAFLYVMQTGLNPSGLQDEKMMIQPKGNLFENATPENTPKLVYNLITFGGGNVKALTPALNSILNNISPRAMMRFMKATDAYMREVAYEVRAASLGASEFSQEQFDAAMRQAEKDMQGSKSNPKEKKRETIIRANEIIANQRLDAVKREFAEQDALEVVYSQKPAGFIGWLASIANKALEVYPVTRLFIPFTNVCANVLNENLNYAPLISQYRLMSAVKLSPLLKGKIELRSGAEKNPFVQGRSEKAAEIAIKSSIGLVASALPFIVSALAGGDDANEEKERPFIQFYSQGPKDPEQNKIWSENGGIKYSIRVGNTYISYLYTPLVIPLSYGQMLKESADEIKKKAGKDKAGDISELMIKALAAAPAIGFVAALDQSFLTGVSDLIELKEAKDIPKAGAGIVRNIVSRMITPGVARDMQKLMIDEKLEGDLYITNMLKEFPGSSAFLDKDLNYFGDPARYNSIMQENGFTRRAFSLIGRITSSENPDPAFEILYKNGITPPKWNQSLQWFDKTPMNKAEQREFVRAAGPLMRQFIIDNEPTIEQIQDTETAQKFISNGISAIRAGVKGQLQAERQ